MINIPIWLFVIMAVLSVLMLVIIIAIAVIMLSVLRLTKNDSHDNNQTLYEIKDKESVNIQIEREE